MSELYSDSGEYRGSIDSSGAIRDDRGTYRGRITESGEIYDEYGNYEGSIWSNGHIYLNGSYFGLIDSDGSVYHNSSYIGRIRGYRGPNSKGSSAIEARPARNSGSHSSSQTRHSVPRPSVPSSDSGLEFVILISLVLCGIVFLIAVAIVAAIAVAIVGGVALAVYGIMYLINSDAIRGKTRYKVLSVAISLVLVLGVMAIMEAVEDAGSSHQSSSISYEEPEEEYTGGGETPAGETPVSDDPREWTLSDYEEFWSDYTLPERKLYYQPDDLMCGDDVRYIQYVLLKCDIIDTDENGDVSGVFDEETDAAVRVYQQDHGLEVDGIVGEYTRAAMETDFKVFTGYDLYAGTSSGDTDSDIDSVLDPSSYSHYYSDEVYFFHFSYPSEYLTIVKNLSGEEGYTDYLELQSDDGLANVELSCCHLGAEEDIYYNAMYWEDTLLDSEEILYQPEASDGAARFIVTGYTEDRSQSVYVLVSIYDQVYTQMIAYTSTKEHFDELNYMVECMYRTCGFSNSSQEPRSFTDYINGIN